jgi:radical SAM superfamily enzyme YgiQ (UPF0313 family)
MQQLAIGSTTKSCEDITEKKLKIGFVHATNKVDVHWFKPLAFGYLKAYLDMHSCSHVEMHLCADADTSEVFDVVAISSTSQDYAAAIEIARKAKLKNKNVITVLGGHHISYLPETLDESFDIAVLGEGEQTFLEIIEYLQSQGLTLNQEKLSKIIGIIFWKNGTIVNTGIREPITPLDSLPHPHRLTGETQYIFTARGCPYKCTFCSSTAFWGKLRFFSAEYVVEEIKMIVEQFPETNHIPIQDDLFVMSLPRFNKICDLLELNGLNRKVEFSFAVRANLITEDLCKSMKRLNVRTVCFGAESASDRVLSLMKKNTVSAQNQLALDILHKHNIPVVCSFIVGFPTETEEEVRATYEFVFENISAGKLLPGSAVNILMPMPGTEVWENAVQEGVIEPASFDWQRLAVFASYRQSNISSFKEWMEYRQTNNSIYLNEHTLPEKRLYEIIAGYEEEIDKLNSLPENVEHPLPHPFFFPESAAAHKYCVGKGIEIGGSAHNPFGLSTLNVDFTNDMNTEFKKEEVKICGTASMVDIVACGDDIPLPDGSQEFILSSHVLEHFPNPIKALLEWDRLLIPGGIIFMIVPHKERTFDKHKDRTLLKHLIKDFVTNNTEPHGDPYGHDHCWITEDILELIDWMNDTFVKWEIVEVQDVDDKVGNGFTIVIRKKKNRECNDTLYDYSKAACHPEDPEQLIHTKDNMISNLESVIRSYKQEIIQLTTTDNNKAKALDEFMEGLKYDTDSASLLVKVGELCFNLGAAESAGLYFEKALSLDPINGDALNNLGVLSFQSGDYQSAKKWFIKTLALDPHHSEAKTNLDALPNSSS